MHCRISIPRVQSDSNVLGEYIEQWSSLGYVQVQQAEDAYIRLSLEGSDFVLWPWPRNTYRSMTTGQNVSISDVDDSHVILFNDVLGACCRSIINPPFFWGRHPELLEAKSQYWHHYADRSFNVGFYGRIENLVQYAYRSHYLLDHTIDDLTLVGAGTKYSLSPNEYYDRLLRTRYSLCLRGYGQKTNRDVESAALGAVIIVPEDTYMGSYRDSLIPGTHYLQFDPRYPIGEQILRISQEEWLHVSTSALEWYRSNCTFTKSFQHILSACNLR